MERKQEALESAFFDAKSKIKKIKLLGIKPDMDQAAKDKLVQDLATAKSLKEPGTKVEDHYKGQDWYVESLVEFSAMSVEEQFEHCYERKFAEQATEVEMLDALAELMSA